ncbi:MAG TPA: cyclic nucleotide-binding domain-containing protein [Intrasporangium sp.]|uniref:cyclic nucleotide-binding domain-containing protein n=1 Tax=Intrasporangium sp. TaxID=1925024 RepID=UPI002B4909D9|nr:cyclic nucleotide-binding domain-containing protein [Intrasporangium sp.]HKX67387.1 cyclic nucleotide-binding domain-containing protein [Intrasporangium sp.]
MARLLTVDRVAMLRHVGIFAATPGRVLAGLAGALTEEYFTAGEEIIRRGTTEDWLHIVSSGTVEILREDGRIRAEAPVVVGDLAVLDPQPRSATVVALTDVTALRLSKADFDEALESRPEIARGVILALVERLREKREPQP